MRNAIRILSIVIVSTLTVLAQAAEGTRIVPVAGSAPGAYGARFRTSLRLTGQGTGRVYFRPQGQFFGDERDPYIAYDLGPSPQFVYRTVYFEDVVEAMGAAGIGSLDIVPDSAGNGSTTVTRVPRVEARVYNDGHANGRFGVLIPALSPAEARTSFLHVPLYQETLATSRINVGTRTFEEPVRMDVTMLDGDVASSVKSITLPANSFTQLSLAALLGDEPICCFRELSLYFHGQGALAYYTVTENSTGDPSLYLHGTLEDPSVIEHLQVTPSGPFVLPISGTMQLNGLEVFFDAVTEDSRCASDVVCVWEGRGQLRLVIRKGSESRTLLISTVSPGIAFGQTIRLIELSPYPAHADRRIDPRTYRATLIIEPG